MFRFRLLQLSVFVLRIPFVFDCRVLFSEFRPLQPMNLSDRHRLLFGSGFSLFEKLTSWQHSLHPLCLLTLHWLNLLLRASLFPSFARKRTPRFQSLALRFFLMSLEVCLHTLPSLSLSFPYTFMAIPSHFPHFPSTLLFSLVQSVSSLYFFSLHRRFPCSLSQRPKQ